jgi:hypothetical protein
MSLKSDFSRTFFTSLSISSRFNDHDPHETRAHVASVVELFSRRRRTLAAAVRWQRRVRHAATPRLRATRRAAQHRSRPTEPCSTAPYPSRLALRTAASDRPTVRPSSALRPVVADPLDRGAPHQHFLRKCERDRLPPHPSPPRSR